MTLTTTQLEAIVARALPDERLRAGDALPHGRYALVLAGGERLSLQVYATPAAAEAAAAALRLLRGEVDLPIAQLRASDPEGATVGVPYLLTSALDGDPLDQLLPRIGDEALYALGRQLGALAARVHRLACPAYGPLGTPGTSTTEREYVLGAVAQASRHAGTLGMLDRRTIDELTAWFDQHFAPAGRQAALVHGGLAPHHLLVRMVAASSEGSRRGSWRISGVLGWGKACGWCPAWEHVTLLDAAGDPRYFGLRVGYGNSYDELTSRTYEQVREHLLAPYRLLLAIQRMHGAYTTGDIAEYERRRSMLCGLMEFLDA